MKPKPVRSCVAALLVDLGSGRHCLVLCQKGTLYCSVGEGPESVLVVPVWVANAACHHCVACCCVHGYAHGSSFPEAS